MNIKDQKEVTANLKKWLSELDFIIDIAHDGEG
jgi:hypothetical protein